jgi:hypothetical protein
MTLDLKLERALIPPQKIAISVVLNQFEISMLHSQLKAILTISKSITKYKK